MANIYDVARLAKVSTTTVSKVLSNTPYVSEPTRQRVLEAMQQLHYSPNLAARGLTHNRTYVIGLIIPHEPDYSFSDPFLLEIIRGVEGVASDNDYNVLVSMAKKSQQRSAYDRLLRTGYVDGVVTVETFKGGIDDRELEARGIPRVSAGYREDHKELNAVHSNDLSGGYQAVEHLVALGHRRIGIISGPQNFIGAMDARLQGAVEALAKHGLEWDSSLLTYGDFSIESGYQAVKILLEFGGERPTAIFAMNDRMALGAIHCARELGLSIPQDLSIVGFDDVPLFTNVELPLTSVRQYPVRIGQMATHRLFSLLNHELTEFEALVLPTELVVRASTAPLATYH